MQGTEFEFEETTLQRLEALGYFRVHGAELERDPREVVLHDRLRAFLQARYPHEAADLAFKKFTNPEGVDPVRRNQNFLHNLTRGVEISYDDADGRRQVCHVYAIDWENPEANTFEAVQQFTVQGRIERRPDVIIFVNGLPLVLFELKSPFDEYKDAAGAFNQLGHYQHDIPQLFEFSAFCVVSDGVTTLHGMATAGLEWWAEWKCINGVDIEPGSTGSMKALVEGLFPKDRLLRYMRNFILFELDGEKLIKKGAKYHQFFVVLAAAENARRAFFEGGDRRLGVVWHTQGSGKSLEMVFLVGILRRSLNNPLIVIQVDAKALDEQLFGAFVMTKWLVGDVTQAETILDLRSKLSNEAGQVVFSTLQKFDLLDGEAVHPELTNRRDVIVIADEAHRSQYGLTYGLAANLRRALPNAKFLGFTGTPIEFGDASTRAVFGEYVEPIFDIKQAQEDKATVPLFYEARLAKLHQTNPAIDQELESILDSQDITEEEARVARWAQMEAAAGTKERVGAIARDIVSHFEQRQETQPGKAMIVCMSRRNCVLLYDALEALRPEWASTELNGGAMKIVMTNRPEVDPIEWNKAGHVTGSEQRKHLAKRLKDKNDALQIAIVCDMWLTGFDAPILNTMYVDKPMKGHNLMQAIARVNRVFKDKPGGLIVDYIGIAEYLRDATARYTTGGGKGQPAPNLEEEGMAQFLERLEAIRELVDDDLTSCDGLNSIELEDLVHHLADRMVQTDQLRDSYLLHEKSLTVAVSLVSHTEEARPYLFEVGIYQRVRVTIRKTMPQPRRGEIDTAVKALVDKSIVSEDVVDIFELTGLQKADISILDDDFLQEFANKDFPNLRLRLLEKLLKDKIALLSKTNPVVARSFREMLEDTLARYHNNALQSAQLIQLMIQMRKQMDRESEAKEQYGLSNEEVAFYDALVLTQGKLYDQPFLAELVRAIVPAVRENLKPDWTRSSRENIQASIRSAVRRVLMLRGVKQEDFDLIIARVMEHAQAVYADWPVLPLPIE